MAFAETLSHLSEAVRTPISERDEICPDLQNTCEGDNKDATRHHTGNRKKPEFTIRDCMFMVAFWQMLGSLAGL